MNFKYIYNLQEKSLAELMDTENDMAKQIRTLDSQMQVSNYLLVIINVINNLII